MIIRFLIVFLGIGWLSAASRHSVPMSTWTIVAIDPMAGDVGVAGASCLPSTHADAIAVLVPGKGAAVAQAMWDLENRNMVYDLLRGDVSAARIVRQVTDRVHDNAVDDRQYGVVTMRQGAVDIAAFTGSGDFKWAGSRQDANRAVSVQGNTLVGSLVVDNALRAFKTDRDGANTLPDRLMRALEAGSAAGGDVRCNNSRVRQTAAAAFVLFARGGDPAYAAVDLGATDQGTARAPWLAISVAERQFGPNPVVELRGRYDVWRRGH